MTNRKMQRVRQTQAKLARGRRGPGSGGLAAATVLVERPPHPPCRRMGKDEKEIRRILDPKHPTKLPAMVEALRALGKRLVVGVEEAA
jgi:hypothetical protein